jgi:hypothetical protein
MRLQARDSGAGLARMLEPLTLNQRVQGSSQISRLSAIAPELAGLFSEALSLRRHP